MAEVTHKIRSTEAKFFNQKHKHAVLFSFSSSSSSIFCNSICVESHFLCNEVDAVKESLQAHRYICVSECAAAKKCFTSVCTRH